MIQNAWLLLFNAGLMKTGWVIGLKYTERWTKLCPSLATIALMAGSFYLLSQDLPVGTAYAVWTGIGVAGTVIIGMLILGDSRDLIRILCRFLIGAGIVGMNVITPE
jgi:quaternary ammonium compound-resistance protein SugE